MTPTAATCATRAHQPGYVGYRLASKDDLVISYTASIVSFVRAPDESGGTGATIRTGCFNTDGTFTVAPLAAL